MNSTLDREFLEIRALIVQLAAAFDRLDRCPDSAADDPRRHRLEAAIGILTGASQMRAEQVQLHFGKPYEAEWREKMGFAKTT